MPILLLDACRLIANSCAPFSIVHANAAFFRLSGLAPDQILGARFSSILESEPNSKHTSLPECMMSSSSGNHKKLVLRAEYPQEATKSRVKVSPIVARKTTSSEATTMTTMTHYVIEFNFDGETPERNIRRPVADSHLAVGVMG